MKILVKTLLVLILMFAVLVGFVKYRYGGGEPFPAQAIQAELAAEVLEVVADLPLPPGNIATATDGRIFFTFHPEARPEVNVAELVNGQAQPWPSMAFQPGGDEPLHFQNVLSLRIDGQGRLWTLDNANHGLGQPRLLAFDIATGEVIHQHDFSRAIAPRLSHLNDFQVSPDGNSIYIADASIMGQKPALIVYDVATREARRLLEGHYSVVAENYVPVVQGRKMEVFGIFAIRPGVDSIALSRDGQWLYYAAVTATAMYRIATADLLSADLNPEDLAQRVERYADKTESDGITSDLAGNIYLSDPGHDSVHIITPERTLRTLVQDQRIRWPDGFSFGPDGWLYVTCSSLHQVIGRTPGQIAEQAPYQIFRFKPGFTAPAGH